MNPTVREGAIAKAKLRSHALALGLNPDPITQLAEKLAREHPLTLPQACKRIQRQIHQNATKDTTK